MLERREKATVPAMASPRLWLRSIPRDQNSPRVVLIDAITLAHSPGTGEAARDKPLATHAARSISLTRETPATAAKAFGEEFMQEPVKGYQTIPPGVASVTPGIPVF